jgi:uncharacterized protein YegL/V8-like Glu-specific endopeptidase
MDTPLDNRIPTTSFNIFPLNAVVAVDVQFVTLSSIANGKGSGITIAPNYVLTAGHNAADASLGSPSSIRTSTSANQPNLKSRDIGAAGDPGANVTNFYFPKNYVASGTGGDPNDIALFRTSDAPIAAADVIGLLAFVNPDTAKGLSIATAGYPAATLPYDKGTTLVISPGVGIGTIRSTTSDGVFTYTENVDTEGGQSGSGVWHTLDGDAAPRVLGVHTYGKGAPFTSSILTFGGDQNGGTLLTTDVYTKIIDQIQAGSGIADANSLPENALVGSDSNFFAFLGNGSGNDDITGSYRKERILGRSGDDKLFGGGADDRLEGGDGTDQALFSDIFTDYTYNITDPTRKFFEFDHAKGSKADARDSLKEIEFGVFEYVDSDKDGKDDDGNLFYVPLQVDDKDNKKLKDGPEINPAKDILNSKGVKTGTITVKSPAWTFDGDVNYSLTLGAQQGTLFNFAYIIDTSGSMRGEPLAQAKNAYQTLTQSLIDRGIAANSEFAVIEFNSSASSTGPIDAATAISTINSLSAGGGTEFGDALSKAQQFFQSRNNNATNIAYFLSDGEGTGASESLQSVAEVRAFGIGGANLTSLNIIDSNDAVLLANPADLITQFSASTVNKDTIDRIDVKLGSTIVETIAPGQLVVDALGRLSYEGTLSNLTVSRIAENQVFFDVVFKDGTPTTSLNYKITSGQEQVITQSNSGAKEVITFSVNQSDFTQQQSALNLVTSQEINGNDLANIITVTIGDNILRGNGGDDRFILDGGKNLIDGGDGIDTVKINKTMATAGKITKNGNVVSIGSDTTLLNTEFIELSDVRLSTDTLATVPILALQDKIVTIVEGNSGSKTATFTINLSSVSTQNVVVDYTTRSENANAGKDFMSSTGQLIIAAGQTSGTIKVDVLGDTEAEGDEQVLIDLVSTGAIFADNLTKTIAGVDIKDDDSIIEASFIGSDSTVIEGSPGKPAKFVITLNRLGSLSGIDTIGYQISSTGTKPAESNDFVNGFTPGQINFAAGESSKNLEILINPDQVLESDETFALKLTSLAGVAAVPSDQLSLTIRNDDGQPLSGSSFNLQKATEDIWTANGGGKVKAAITGKNTNQPNEIGVFKLAADNTINGIAVGAAGFAQAALANSTTLFTALPDQTTDGLDLSRVFNVANGDRLGFFMVANGTIEQNLKYNNFNNVLFSIDPANPGNKDSLQVTEAAGAFTLNWEQGNDNTFQDLSISLTTDSSPDSPLSSISGLQSQPAGEILDLRAFAGQNLQATFTVKREAAYNNVAGFYKIDDAEGTVTSLTGVKLKPEDIGYKEAALFNKIAGLDIIGENQKTITIEKTVTGGDMYAPYLIINGNNPGFAANSVYTVFSQSNFAQVDQVRLLGENTFGFEDLILQGGDFNDLVVQASFKTV